MTIRKLVLTTLEQKLELNNSKITKYGQNDSAINPQKSVFAFIVCVSDSLLDKIDLTRKQFYLRISSLLSTGLINRILGRYCITSFGKINYEIQLLLGMAVDIHIAASKIEEIPLSSRSNMSDTTDATHGNTMIARPISRIS